MSKQVYKFEDHKKIVQFYNVKTSTSLEIDENWTNKISNKIKTFYVM